jgi:L-fuculose-phosphate aldolase
VKKNKSPTFYSYYVMSNNSLTEERETISELGVEMLEEGLTKGTGGNISSRDENGAIAVSPSGIAYEDIEPHDVPIVDESGSQIEGELKPSNETPMHTTVYNNREDVGGIVHTHSPYISTFAALSEPIPASNYLIAFIGQSIPVADYAPPGSEELGKLVIDQVGTDYDACILQNHGLLAVGESATEAFETALMAEHCAQIHYQACCIGDPVIMSDENVDALIGEFRDYRKTSK